MTTSLQTCSDYTKTKYILASIQDTYTAHFRDYLDWLGEKDFSTASVRDYMIYLNQDSQFAPGTIRIKRQAVKKRLKQYAYENMDFEQRARMNDFLEELDRNGETKAPKMQSVAISKDKYLTKDEVQELLLKCRTRKQVLFIRFLWYTGCRINEMTGIKLSDMKQIGEMWFTQVRGKGNKYRPIRISDSIYKAVRECFRGETYLFETEGGKRYIDGYISAQVKKLGRQMLRKDISAHTLRHSFATHKVKKGTPIDALADYLGHSDPAITLKMYCHNQVNDVDLMDDDIDIESV